MTAQTATVQALADQVNQEQLFYTKKLDKERQRLMGAAAAANEMALQIRERKRLLSSLAKDRPPGSQPPLFGGSRGDAARERMDQKVETLEARKNTVLRANGRLKKRVNELRRDKTQYLGIHREREDELRKKRALLLARIQETQRLSWRIDDTKREIEAVTQKALAELGDFANTLEEVSQNVHANLDEAASSRLAQGSMFGGARASSQDAGEAGAEAISEQNRNLKDMTKKAYWAVQKRQIDLQKQSDHRAQLEVNLVQLKDETGIGNVTEIVQYFLEAEEREFSLCSQINDQSKVRAPAAALPCNTGALAHLGARRSPVL